MREKKKSLIEWAKEASAEWKFIPSLKGKRAVRNLIILRLIATSPAPKSAWDLALEYLKRTDPIKFGLWTPDTLYHKRQVENAKMNRNLRFLEDKRYVQKLGSVYKLSGKAIVLLFAIDPKILKHFSPALLNDVSDVDLEKPEWVTRVRSQELLEAMSKELDSNTIASDTMSFAARKILLAYKINMDEIDSQQLMELLLDKFGSRIK
jgi:hypothetical protein